MSWQPISTFPIPPFNKEEWFMPSERVLIVRRGGLISLGRYRYTERGKGRWQDALGYNCEPTHWQPLPDPPAEKEQAE